jgi:hypothetical protein
VILDLLFGLLPARVQLMVGIVLFAVVLALLALLFGSRLIW